MKQMLSLLVLGFLLSAFQSDTTPADLRKLKKDLRKNFVYVPSGTMTLDQKKVSVQGFYMFAGEVTNLQYREFLADLLSQGRFDDYHRANIDSLAWRMEYYYNEPFVEHYHLHPAYSEYPVVNISHEGAKLYCVWLTEVYRKNGVFAADDTESVVRLPSASEWKYAAAAGHDGAPYSWGGYYVRDENGKFLANFNHALNETAIHYNETTKTYEVNPSAGKNYASTFGTSPSRSYVPNDFMLFNMCGNVAEFVNDSPQALGGSWASAGYDIRIESSVAADQPAPTVGFRPVLVFRGRGKL